MMVAGFAMSYYSWSEWVLFNECAYSIYNCEYLLSDISILISSILNKFEINAYISLTESRKLYMI